MGFLDRYKNRTAKDEENAMRYLVDNLIVDNKHDNNRAISLLSNDIESVVKDRFIPSIFYTFIYEPKNPETIGDIKFFDIAPLIFCIGFDGKYVTGINFNMIPNNIRASILDIIVDAYPSFYKNADEDNMINKDLSGSLMDEKFRNAFVKCLGRVSGISLDGAIRKYDLENIRNIKPIDYAEWEYIPYLSFKDAIRGANLMDIQANLTVDNSR